MSDNTFGGLSGEEWKTAGLDALSILFPMIVGGARAVGAYGGLVKNQFDKAGEYTRKNEELVDKQISDLGSWYQRESSTPFVQTEAAASALEQLRKTLAETLAGQNNMATSAGATNEAKIAGRKAATSQYSDAVNKLVGYGTNRNDQLSRDYQYRIGQWLQAKLGHNNMHAQNYSTAGLNLLQAPVDIFQSTLQGLGSIAKFM